MLDLEMVTGGVGIIPTIKDVDEETDEEKLQRKKKELFMRDILGYTDVNPLLRD